jgi:valyl-tRNA synthetase
VAREDPDRCTHCGSAQLQQESDVLDTWFSSGLWPFSTLGWPDDTPDLRSFYPTSLLVTGFDIIFFWCARMIMFGIEMMGDVPFRQVHIHGLVRDAERQKMSKTKGNTIDPLVINDKYGTDAVRFALLVSAAPGNDIALSEDRIDAEKAFANKIWNASRLLFGKPREGSGPRDSSGNALSLADRWIGSRLNACAKTANTAFEQHRYHEAAETLYHFWWGDFCDWYLEFKKFEGDWSYAYDIYEKALRLLHPLMPFITEELWHRLDLPGKSIALAEYPRFNPSAEDSGAEERMQLVQDLVTEARAIRADNKIDLRRKMDAAYNLEIDEERRGMIERLANVALIFDPQLKQRLSLDIPVDRGRVERESGELEKQIAALERQFANPEFLNKAPEKVIAAMRAKRAEYEKKLAENRAALGG